MFIKKIKVGKEPRPKGYGYVMTISKLGVENKPPSRTCVYCIMPLNIAFRLVYIIISWVREPFPNYKRRLNVAVATVYKRDAQLAKREETIRLIGYYIKEQGKRLESRKIGNTRFVNSVIAFVVNLIKDSEPKLYDELYPAKVPSKSTDQ